MAPDTTWSPIRQGVDPLRRWSSKRPRVVRLTHDLFDRRINSETIRAAWDAMWAADSHRFLIVTSDTERLRKWTRRNACMRGFAWVDLDHAPTMDPGDIIHMDELYYRGRCGWVDNGIDSNNGYGCSHPNNDHDHECHTFSCPIAYSAGLCESCRKEEEECTCERFYENEDLMELHSRPRWAVARNVWIGTRVSTCAEAEARLPDLMSAKGAVRFVESVPGLDLSRWIREGSRYRESSSLSEDRSIGWVVVDGVWTPTTKAGRAGRRRLPLVTASTAPEVSHVG